VPTSSPRGPSETQLREVITRYFDACNEASLEKMVSCFTPDAVHYFPAGAPQGPFVGAIAIADGWKRAVATLGSVWTIDRMLIDSKNLEAVIEWTHFKPVVGGYLRGDEWYRFTRDGLISEIRAYYACPATTGRVVFELGGYDYSGRGYPLEPPPVTRARD
jgi:ketosteroid isomerase-like protein